MSTSDLVKSAKISETSIPATTINVHEFLPESIPLIHNDVVPTDSRFLNRPMAEPEQLKAVGVGLEWREYIRILDSDTDQNGFKTVLLHYISTVNENGKVNFQPMQYIGHIRGIILRETSKRETTGGPKWEIICKSFPYTPELVIGESELPIPANSKAYSCHEGTIIRLYWTGNLGCESPNDRWAISTHRKIDAETSRWSGPTFGEMFGELNQLNPDNLKKEIAYVFVLIHSANRLVYPVKENKLIPVSEFNRSTGTLTVVQSNPIDLKTTEDLVLAVNSMDSYETPEAAGVILFHPFTAFPIKVISKNYHLKRSVRGNEASIRTRYTQLRGTPAQELLVSWYPESVNEFNKVEREITGLSKYLHSEYINRNVKKSRFNTEFERLPKEYHVFLMNCHNWYKENKTENIVTVNAVETLLKKVETHYLLKMLKEYRNAEKKTKIGKM